MVKCEVIIIGRDGQPHSETVHAPSLFAAAAKGLSGVCRLWWYDPTVLYQVSVNGESAPLEYGSGEPGLNSDFQTA